jgi:hypothetical protein
MDFIEPIKIGDAQLLTTNVLNDVDDLGVPIVVWAPGQSITIGLVRRYESVDQHWIVRALTAHTASDLNKPTGLDNDPNWVYMYDTNPRRMFDNSSTSQSSQADLINVTMGVTEAVNSVAALNLDGQSITFTMYDLNNTEVYTHTEQLIRTDNVYDWWTYFFSPIERKKDVILTELPIYYLSKMNVQINHEGQVAKCGALIIGLFQSAGFTEYGMKIGNRDYSIKTADEFGNYVITERKFSKTLTLNSVIDASKLDGLRYKFDDLRATPIVYIGSTEYTSSYVFGFYKDCYTVAQYPSHAIMNFEIEGLA